MDTIIVTVHIAGTQRVMDLELSADVPMSQLIPALVKGLKLPETHPNGQFLAYQLVATRGQNQLYNMQPVETLMSAGVVTGTHLFLAQSGIPIQSLQNSRVGLSGLLRSRAGRVIVLDNFGQTHIRLGRYDARVGIRPEVDFSDDPDGETVSRDHARLDVKAGQWTLTAMSETSPTLVNGQRLSRFDPMLLKTGDKIQLGDVQLSFEIAQL